MTTLSPESSRAAQRASDLQPPQTAKDANAKRQRRRKVAAVSWYGRLLIIATLMVAAGWEIFQWILMIITQD